MDYDCLLQYRVIWNSTETSSTERWKQLKTKTKDWKGLGNFRNIFESTDWAKGAEGLHVHERCYITLSSKQSLQQSRKRKEKKMLKNLQLSLRNKVCRKKNISHMMMVK